MRYVDNKANPLYRLKGGNVELEVLVVKIIYSSDNFGVYSLKKDDNHLILEEYFSATGNIQLEQDKTYRIKGTVVDDEKYGLGLKITSAVEIIPKGRIGIVSFLASVPGIDSSTASLIWNEFGHESISQIIKAPQSLRLNYQDTKRVVRFIKNKEKKIKAIEVLVESGVDENSASQLLNSEDWEEIYSKCLKNPYVLIETNNFSFSKADNIARQLGAPANTPLRIEAASIYLLKYFENLGNCYLPLKNMIKFLESIVSVYNPLSKDYGTVQVLSKNSQDITVKYFGIETTCPIQTYVTLSNKVYTDINHPNRFNKHGGVLFFKPSESFLEKCIRENEKLKLIDDKVYYLPTYEKEISVAESINFIQQNKSIRWEKDEVETTLNKILEEKNIELSAEQYKACVDMASFVGGMNCLIGSAGCGKTFCLNIFIKLYKQLANKYCLGSNIKLLAPTGRAATVAKNATQLPASTIHKACQLKYDENSQNCIDENPEELSTFKDVDIVIVDEASMLSLHLTDELLKYCRHCKVIFVGDVKQLLPIGAGKILIDILNSGVADVCLLKTIKRQSENSGIIFNAEQIISESPLEDKSDCRVIYTNDERETTKTICEIYADLLKNNPIKDIQVITSMKSYENGVNLLNYQLQNLCNPLDVSKDKFCRLTKFNHNGKYFEICIHKGDKVIHTKNDYNCFVYKRLSSNNYQRISAIGISNGDIGIVEDIIEFFDEDLYKKISVVVVKYEDGYRFYYKGSSQHYCRLSELNIAYAITIHKSQGSQWPHVIIPVSKIHKKMMNNNLLYTALTRASDSAYLIGDKSTLTNSVKIHPSIKRFTDLDNKIRIKAALFGNSGF